MPNLTIRLTTVQLEELKKLSSKNKVTITEYILNNTVPHTMSNNLMLNQIISKALELEQGELFSVKALFSYSEWDNFSKNSKISSCRRFLKSVKENEYNLANDIEFIKKDSSNLAIYRRK